jgi:hypothetical protein
MTRLEFEMNNKTNNNPPAQAQPHPLSCLVSSFNLLSLSTFIPTHYGNVSKELTAAVVERFATHSPTSPLCMSFPIILCLPLQLLFTSSPLTTSRRFQQHDGDPATDSATPMGGADSTDAEEA